jgi:hypothetical protein
MQAKPSLALPVKPWCSMPMALFSMSTPLLPSWTRCFQGKVRRLAGSGPVVVFVSANSWDIQGAGAFGLRTYWLNRAGQAGDELGFPPGAVVKQLAELAEMVGSQASSTHQ